MTTILALIKYVSYIVITFFVVAAIIWVDNYNNPKEYEVQYITPMKKDNIQLEYNKHEIDYNKYEYFYKEIYNIRRSTVGFLMYKQDTLKYSKWKFYKNKQ